MDRQQERESVTSPPPRWGSDAIDLHARDLPALKVSFLVRHAPHQGKLLEFGCGEGKIMRTLARERPQLELIGCDVRDVPPRDAAFEFRHMSSAAPGGALATRLPARDGELDAVVFADVLEHTADPEAIVKELWRVIRPGGSLVGFVPLEGEPRSAYALYCALLGSDLYLRTKHHQQRFTRQAALALLGDFRLLEARYAYHLLGQTLDATFFAAALLPRLERFWWTENRYYRPASESAPAATSRSATLLPRALNRLLELGNRLAYEESRLLARQSRFAAGLLFAARRP